MGFSCRQALLLLMYCTNSTIPPSNLYVFDWDDFGSDMESFRPLLRNAISLNLFESVS